MSKKGLDTLFVHYGIRREDMQVIEALCNEYEVDFDWLQEDILKLYHEKKIRNEDLDEKALKKVLEKALQKI
ncbi:DNA modification system-associated small protein [Christiangramia sp. OXR-203]|uniref:DNA modification system-associated small protein n=1 Tax=Christiangramia sp. OXR-203 TaxID=3100176 RepID=UPI002AC91959|nr:DNA modification system-associated small protein [Christiangramia sp. OXR-203]WPY97064.1 DNA modification system-associated small protein [Christiangramia sp. OXR-203]